VRLTVSAFEPFGGRKLNRSWELASRLLTSPPEGLTLDRVQLPVSFASLPAAVDALVGWAVKTGARGLVMLGESSHATGLEIERVALNLIDANLDDNAGERPRDRAVREGAVAAIFSTAPVRALLEAARAAGAPAELSLSAGAFACNAAYFMALASAPKELPVVFVHVPDDPAAADPAVLTAGLAAIAVLLASHGRS
jgi:pyroglutamyl-peptidase